MPPISAPQPPITHSARAHTRAEFLKRSAGLTLMASAGWATVSRLIDPPLARAGTTSSRFPAWRTVNVRSHGAVGDGTRDDSAALGRALAAMGSRSVLYFPPGTYRFARRWPAGGAAIALDGLSDVCVEMAPGAELLLDNLDATGGGTSHGIAVRGACSNVHLVGCVVRWGTIPAYRGFGDGFRFLGYPSDGPPPPAWTATSGTVRDVMMSGCTATGAPQTGAVFMGCAGVRVRDFTAVDTRADGLQLNACREVTISGYTALRPGDDGLAFVTYHDPTQLWAGDQGPFNQPSLGRWSNSSSTATGVVIRSGAANGLRIAGSRGVSVRGLSVSDVRAGVIVDSGRVGPDNGWQYLASRRCRVEGVRIDRCQVGILVQVFNASSDDAPKWWRADMEFSRAAITSCSQYSIRVEGDGTEQSAIAGIRLSGIRVDARTTDAPVSLSSLRDGWVKGISVIGTSIAFYGTDRPLVGPISGLPRSNLALDGLTAHGGGISLQDIAGVTVGRLRSVNAPYTGLGLTRVRAVTIASASIVTPNRRNDSLARGVLIAKGQEVRISRLTIRHDANDRADWRSLEIGGGDATDISKDVRFARVRYSNLLDQTGSDVVVQGGPHQPRRCSYSMDVFNGGAQSPAWAVEKWGDTSSPFPAWRPPA